MSREQGAFSPTVFVVASKSFVEGRLSAVEFRRIYFALYLRATVPIPELYAPALEKLFYLLEDYVDPPDIREETDLTEDELREGVAEVLGQLRGLRDG